MPARECVRVPKACRLPSSPTCYALLNPCRSSTFLVKGRLTLVSPWFSFFCSTEHNSRLKGRSQTVLGSKKILQKHMRQSPFSLSFFFSMGRMHAVMQLCASYAEWYGLGRCPRLRATWYELKVITSRKILQYRELPFY